MRPENISAESVADWKLSDNSPSHEGWGEENFVVGQQAWLGFLARGGAEV